ncbi:DCC1-like thiol-disulfide oxidoreductase family protein [Porticoccaceae bacterium LTM1]|nr:DCC1-like thiol-disulfide oxidoreductase family protein [Porticoccaceae bacterium LTM1]
MRAPNINEGDKVVLFDGVCKLCSGWAKFLIRFDRHRKIKLATVQSGVGREILTFYGLPQDTYETMVYLEGGKLYVQSAAFLKVMSLLPFPWPMFSVFWIMPKSLRDWLYDRIALNRYELFGRNKYCLMPDVDHESRYLSKSKTRRFM